MDEIQERDSNEAMDAMDDDHGSYFHEHAGVEGCGNKIGFHHEIVLRENS
jgi:hypothetical protein